MLGTGNNLSRGVATSSPDVTPLQQCLPLEPIDHSFGVSHLKPPAQVGNDDLKCIKETVQNAKMLSESIFKLDKYKEAINSKKWQRTSLVKMGSQIHRNPHDPMNHRLDDRAKSVTLNKRIRTSVADQRSATTRHQMFTDKDVNSLQAVNGSYVRIEEKSLRLLAGGEGLDNKIKKKRSVGAGGNRVSMLDGSFEPINSDGSTVLKSEHETASLPRDRLAVLEQKLLGEGSNNPNTVTKGKVSRAPRTSSVMALDSFPSTLVVAGMVLNPKHPASAGSPVYPMAQWVGQRPHKNTRTRRTNLVSPVSTEPQNSSPALATSDFSARTSSMLVNGKIENLTSPYSFSESEESRAGENKIKEKKFDPVDVAYTTSPKVGSLVFPLKKNRIPTIEIGDGLKRHGRSGRGSSLARPGIGRSHPPSKTLKDCKALTRLWPMPSNGSSDFTGESDDDHEEFYLAATAACNCILEKKNGIIFTPVSSEDASYLKKQVRDAEELSESLSLIFGNEFNRLDDLCGRFDTGRSEKDNPLYQRVLSALNVEVESDDPCYPGEGKNISLQYASDDSQCGSCNQIDIEPKDKDIMEIEVDCLLDRLSCDSGAITNSFRNPSMASSLTRSHEQWQVDDDFIHSDVGIFIEICSNDLGQPHLRESYIASFPTSYCQYQSMGFNDRLLLELQSIGLYPEILPNLTVGEDVINEHIMELKIGKIEQVAKDQLIQMVYRKQMALCESNAPKSYVRKVSKQVALACVKHTLTRCWKFEDDPALQDLYPSGNNDTKSIDGVRSGTASNEALHQAELRGSKEEEPIDFSKLQFDPMENLGVSEHLGAHQDFSSWLNFYDGQGLQELNLPQILKSSHKQS
ncbi:hypothetical protein UlMin_043445 [Ulmus minor]